MKTGLRSPPRVCLLHDGLPTGGIATVCGALLRGLRGAGWQVLSRPTGLSNWAGLWRDARASDVLLAVHGFRPAYVASGLGLVTRRPVVVWMHGPLQEVLQQAGAGPSKRAWLHWLYRHLQHCVFVSHSTQQSFERFVGAPLPPAQCRRVVRNPAPRDKADSPCMPRSDAVRLGYLGRLSAEKNPQLLIDTLRLLPATFRLTLAGDGPLRETLEANAADLVRAGRVRFLGHVTDGKGFCQAQDLTLLGSRYEGGCPMAALESFSAGVPCIALPIASLVETVQPHAPYLLARDHTAAALAEATLATLRQPAARLQADLDKVLAQHRLQDFMRDWQDVLRKAAGRC